MQERGNPLLKKIDRYLGIPLIFCLGLLRRKKTLPHSANIAENPRFLFLKTGAVGDSILLSAIALEIKEKWPQAQVTLLCTRANYGIVPLLAGVDDVLLFNLNSILHSLKKLQKSGAFDFAIDFGAWPRLNSLITFFAPADFRLGFWRRGQYRHYVYDKAIVHKDIVHELDNYRNLLHALKLETKGLLPRIKTKELKKKFGTGTASTRTAKSKRSLAAYPSLSQEKEGSSSPEHAAKLQSIASQYIKPLIFHPFPGGTKKEFKMWPIAHWESLGTDLLMQGYSIWITGASADQEEAQKLADKIILSFVRSSLKELGGRSLKNQKQGGSLKDKNRVLSLAGQLTWEETAWLLLKAKALVTVNTGIMHLGAALGCKVLALNGPVPDTRWGALGKQVLNFKSDYECSPCLSLGFEYACTAGGCMTRIRAQDVARALGKG